MQHTDKEPHDQLHGLADHATDARSDELSDYELALEGFTRLLKDDSTEAEEERVKIIKNVFTFEWVSRRPSARGGLTVFPLI